MTTTQPKLTKIQLQVEKRQAQEARDGLLWVLTHAWLITIAGAIVLLTMLTVGKSLLLLIISEKVIDQIKPDAIMEMYGLTAMMTLVATIFSISIMLLWNRSPAKVLINLHWRMGSFAFLLPGFVLIPVHIVTAGLTILNLL